jgi:hypothetical protein
MTGPITANHAPALAEASRPDRPRSSAGRDAAIPAAPPGASLEIPVTGLTGAQAATTGQTPATFAGLLPAQHG